MTEHRLLVRLRPMFIQRAISDILSDKLLRYTQSSAQVFFWRTHTGAELDYVEQRDGELFGFEFKSGARKVSPPKTWLETYPKSHYKCITRETVNDFILRM